MTSFYLQLSIIYSSHSGRLYNVIHYFQEETLPLKNDILDDIVKNVIGIDPEKLAIKIDATGKEFPVEQSASVDRR